MANEIGTVLIPAPVVQLKNTQFIENGVIVPQLLEVPCRNVHVDVGQYWAIPTKDNGIFTGLWYQPATTITGEAISQPTFDSFQVLRIRDKSYPSDYTWWIISTLAQYTAACNTCCGETMTPIPFTVPVIAPCQNVCDATDSDGNYYAVFAAPDLGAGEEYNVNGSLNNEEVPAFDATSLDDLISELNSNFDGSGSSPAIEIVWTRDGNTIIGTIQDGLGENTSICLVITADPTSP